MSNSEEPEILPTVNLNLSAPSPSPIHTHISSPILAPTIQGQADIDMTNSIKMEASQDTPEISDTIVVGGEYSDESQEFQDGSDDSFDAYGEDDEGQEQKDEPGAVHDDYARTFDSPTNQEQQQQVQVAADQVHAQPDQDVSKDSETMNSSSTPDLIKKSQSPIALPPPREVQRSPSPSVDPVGSNSSSPSGPLNTAAPNASPSPAPSPPAARPAPDELKDASSSAHAPSPTPSRPPLPPTTTATTPSPTSANEDDTATLDIQKLVDDIAARADATASPPASSSNQATLASQVTPATSLNLSHHASLPPKPAVAQQTSHPLSIPQPNSFEPRKSSVVPPLASPMSNANSAILSLPAHPPSTALAASQLPAYPLPPNIHPIPSSSDVSLHKIHASSNQQEWDAFMADEKRYTSEAKWERFPDGSRIFVGNLSSERVSKREVFNVFHKFGRLGQISLKSAFGFVQYHTAEEGKVALENAQGIELGGRKIHLEISRTKKKEERIRSPDRRDSRAGRDVDRYDGRDPNWRRDDYRPARSPSPRRNDLRGGSRDGFHPRGDRDREARTTFDRRRSRSPPRFTRHDNDSYRRRSPSPPCRAPLDTDRLDIPRRYGSDIPDVQLLLLQEVERDFVAWVQRAFHDRGLKTDVMFLNPRFPRDALVQRQVIEGVHAIVDLDYAAQAQSKLSIQVFMRSGDNSVRFELYQGVDPTVAAELVLREKQHSAPPPVQPVQPPSVYPQNNYGAAYPYPYPHAAGPSVPVQPTAPAPDLASMVGQLDNTALQALLASLQTGQLAPPQQAPYPGFPPPAPTVDIGYLLGNLRNVATGQPAVPSAQGYGSAPSYLPPGASPMSTTGGVPNSAMVQNIMDQLKRAAQ